MVRLILFFVFALVISAAIFAGQRVGEWPAPGSVSEPENTAAALIGGPFTLTDQHGNVVTESILGDHWSVIYFGYTFCPDVCPLTLQNVSLAIEDLGGRGDRVQPIFISVDPWRDTPEVMEFYAANFHPRMLALSGTPEQVAEAAASYRVFYAPTQKPDDPNFLVEHTSLLYVTGPDGRYVTHISHTSSVEEIVAKLRELL